MSQERSQMIKTAPKMDWVRFFVQMPPPRLERGSLAPEANALSTELWGQCEAFYHAP